jgi:methanogenic corrinoid protein MtbC1
MPKVIKMIKSKNPDVVVMVGGAPLTTEIASLYGADGYAHSAATAVQETAKLVEKKQ